MTRQAPTQYALPIGNDEPPARITDHDLIQHNPMAAMSARLTGDLSHFRLSVIQMANPNPTMNAITMYPSPTGGGITHSIVSSWSTQLAHSKCGPSRKSLPGCRRA